MLPFCTCYIRQFLYPLCGNKNVARGFLLLSWLQICLSSIKETVYYCFIDFSRKRCLDICFLFWLPYPLNYINIICDVFLYINAGSTSYSDVGPSLKISFSSFRRGKTSDKLVDIYLPGHLMPFNIYLKIWEPREFVQRFKSKIISYISKKSQFCCSSSRSASQQHNSQK